MAESRESKTEEATPKKREDERKKGNIFQSEDVVSSLSILFVFLILKLVFQYMYRYYCNFFIQNFSYIKAVSNLNESFALLDLKKAAGAALLLCAPVMAASMLAAIVTSGAQTRFKVTGEKIKFKLSNISPIQGLKNLFSMRSVMEFVKALIKVVAGGYILYQELRNICNQCISMLYGDVGAASAAILNDVIDLVIQLSLVFIGVAVIDYFYQRWDYERNIKMTKEEVKEEFKQLEGNPETKGRIRQLQRQMSRQRMMQKVPTADVVVRNPTHFAVALRYKPETDAAPVVVAKGQDYLALRIVKVAEKYRIPMKEDKPLARALYAAVDVGNEIPAEFYQALAELMAWVYRLKKERSQDER